MNLTNTHTIRTVCFELSSGSDEAAHEGIDFIRSMNIDQVIAKALQPYDETTDWIRLDKFKVELGTIDHLNEKNWTDEIIAQIRSQLESQIRFSVNRTEYSVKLNASKEPEVTSTSERKLTALLFYLQHGFLPWYLKEFPQIDVVFRELIKEQPAKLAIQLKSILKDHHVRKRIVWMLSEENVLQLLMILVDPLTYEIIQQIIFLVRKALPEFQKLEPGRTCLMNILECISRNYSSPAIFTEALIENSIPLLSSVPENNWELTIRKTVANYEPKIANQISIMDLVEKLIQNRATKSASIIISNNEKSEKSFDTPLEDNEELKEEEEKEPIDTPLFIENAGLVLLNQGLIKQYFRDFNWINERKEFISEDARHTAISWLHYLTHGNENVQEYKLVLNKIMCGMGPEAVADTNHSLTEIQKQAADNLLQSVLDHWTAVKKTSIENLRISFLQRNGRLKMENDSWHLHAESKPYDILIEKIPWTFSIIKTPWMKKPLYTQWLTRI